jgi:hypothetical protein
MSIVDKFRSFNGTVDCGSDSTSWEASMDPDTRGCAGQQGWFKFLDCANGSNPGNTNGGTPRLTNSTKLYILHPGDQPWKDGKAISECRLVNSSYSVDFTFTDGQQNLSLRSETVLHHITALWATSLLADAESDGYRVMAYQAVMHCLGYLIGGWLEGVFVGGDGLTGPTKVTSTSLFDTEEFASYRGDQGHLPIGVGPVTNRSFIYGVEQLMKNITFNLFSNNQFL